MPSLINSLVGACMLGFLLLALIDFSRARILRKFLIELGGTIVAGAILRVTTGFPTPSPRIAFGASGLLPVIGLMLAAIVLGMAAQYFFFLRRPFSWMSFAKPLCVSPIVLLPLIGTLQGVAAVEPVQLLSLSLLAFQNGFFWRVVFYRAYSRI